MGAQGGEKYQQAYYVYEELAQAPTSSSAQTLVGQAVAELHMGRLEEAEVALQQALEKNPSHAEALANSIVLAILAGKEFAEYLRYVFLYLGDGPAGLDLKLIIICWTQHAAGSGTAPHVFGGSRGEELGV